jgi:hypothetical protein
MITPDEHERRAGRHLCARCGSRNAFHHELECLQQQLDRTRAEVEQMRERVVNLEGDGK